MTSGINIHDPWQTPGCDPCFKGRLLLTAHDQRARLMQFELTKEKAANRQNEAFLICLEILHACHLTMLPLLPGLMQAADKALDALKRMRAGMAADRKVGRSKMKSEMTALFRPGNKRKSAKRQSGVTSLFAWLIATRIESQQLMRIKRNSSRLDWGRRFILTALT